MKVLIALYGNRLLKQKFFYIFIAALAFASYAYAFLISSPEMFEMLNVEPESISGIRFPEFMFRFYSSNVGTLFMAFITALYINEEEHKGILTRPLLHGKTRLDLLHGKLITLCLASLVMVLLVYISIMSVSVLRWGGEIFAMPMFGATAEKYFLVAVSMTALEIGIILASLYARNSALTVGIVFGVTMLGSVLNTRVPALAALVSVNYYPQYWVVEQEFLPVTPVSAIMGLIQSLGYGILFYFLCRRRILRMNFSR